MTLNSHAFHLGFNLDSKILMEANLAPCSPPHFLGVLQVPIFSIGELISAIEVASLKELSSPNY
jgi:hypothetical protein